eukprot:s176_g32.t1
MAAPIGQGKWMQSAVGFGGYPEFQARRSTYNQEELSELTKDEATELQKIRSRVEHDLCQLRLLHQVMLQLHRNDFKPEAPTGPTGHTGPIGRPWAELARTSVLEVQGLLLQAGGWQGLSEPLVFGFPPDLKLPYESRDVLLSKASSSASFQTATVLCDPLAAQFGPSMLGDERSFQEAFQKGNCFSQLALRDLQPGSVPWECWRSIPEWMRCSMVVVSTGPGGNGVAFHKHGTAWLALQQGQKRWWLYPPRGPPAAAYDAVALCPAAKLPEVVLRLPVEDRPVEIVQRPGDVVFVPALWWHATYDDEPTLGIGSQFSMAEVDILQCQERHPESAFAQYHAACELHKGEEHRARVLFEAAIEGEPLNFYYATNQVLFYLNMVFHPRPTLEIIQRLMKRIQRRLDTRRQMIVQRFFIPTVCNFIEWHLPHDGLLKYSIQAAECAWDALLSLLQPMLPGGEAFRLSSSLPWQLLGVLEYTSQCFHCGAVGPGKAGEPGSVRAHRFFCFSCAKVRDGALCQCGRTGQDGPGQLGLLNGRAQWFCATCWSDPKRLNQESQVRWEIVILKGSAEQIRKAERLLQRVLMHSNWGRSEAKVRRLLKPPIIESAVCRLSPMNTLPPGQKTLSQTQPILSIGKDKGNDIVIPAQIVSRQHCVLELDVDRGAVYVKALACSGRFCVPADMKQANAYPGREASNVGLMERSQSRLFRG